MGLEKIFARPEEDVAINLNAVLTLDLRGTRSESFCVPTRRWRLIGPARTEESIDRPFSNAFGTRNHRSNETRRDYSRTAGTRFP
jgi:hypothetical protein